MRVAGGVVGGAALVGAVVAALLSPETSAMPVLDRIGVALAVGVVAVLIVAGVLGVRPPRVEVAEPASATGRWRMTLLLAGIPFVGWLALHLLFWPGLMNPDMGIQWFELERTGLDDWHPYVVSVAVGALRHVVDSPALPVLLQVTGASLLVGRFAAWTVWRGRSPWVAGATLVLLPLIPATGLFTVTLWKDTAFGIALLGLALVVWRIEDTDGRWLASPQNMVWSGIAIAGVWFTRHTGWPIVVGTMVIVLVAHRRWWKPVVIVTGATALLALVVQLPLADLLDVRANRQTSTIYAQHVANHVNRGTELSRSERGDADEDPEPRRAVALQLPLDPGHVVGPGRAPARPPRARRGRAPVTRDRPRAAQPRWRARSPRAARASSSGSRGPARARPTSSSGRTTPATSTTSCGSTTTHRRRTPHRPARSHASTTPSSTASRCGCSGPRSTSMRCSERSRSPRGAGARGASPRLAAPVALESLVLAALTLVQDVRFQYGVILTAVVLVPALLTVARRDADDDAPLRWRAAAPD